MVKRITIILALCCALTATLFSQSFDPDFQPFVTRPGDVEKLALMPDGRFVVAGSFSLANRVERTNIARFLADGSLDETFQPSLNFAISALAVQPDGKVLIGGRYLDEGAPEGITILRLNTNGSLDNSFQAGFAPDGSFADIAVENNGTILVGGSFTEFAGQAVQGVVRLSSGGTLQNVIPLNTSGVVFVSSLLVQSSGRFAVGGTVNEQGYLSYHEYSGAPVAGFNFSITLPGTTNILVGIRDLAQDSQGRIIFSAGTFLIRYAVGVINTNGSYGQWNYVFGIPLSIAVDSNDNIFVGGDYEGVSGVHAFDPATGLTPYAGGIGADGLVRKVVVHPGGGFLITGHFSAYNGQPHMGIARLTGGGVPVAAFSSALERTGFVRTILRSGADKAYISGEFAMVGNTYSPNIARIFLDNGAPDPGFANPGISYRNEIRQIGLDAQGRLLAAGTNLHNANAIHEAPLLRLLPSGAYDPAFQLNPATYPVGRITEIQPLANGQLLVIGDFNVFDSGLAASKVALYNGDGSLVRSFSSRVQVGSATDILRLSSGAILLGGRDIRYDGAAPQPILRLDAALNRDPAFQSPAAITCPGDCRFKFTEQQDGKLLVGGVFFTAPDQEESFRMVRLQPNGALDDSFQLSGVFSNHENYVDGGPRRMLNLPDGRILTVGLFDSLGLLPAPSMILLEDDGSVADNLPGLSFERQFLFDALLLDGGDFLVSGILSDPGFPMQAGLARVTYEPQLTTRITGQVYTPSGQPVEGVEIGIVGQPSANLLTDADGNYDFTSPQAGSDYTVMPMLNTAHSNGVSTFDLLLINQHILGNNRFGSPYQVIAADVNNSQSLTTLDLISIQRMILGRIAEFPNNFSWRFVDASYVFPNPMNPWQETFPERIVFSGLPAGGVQDVDFIAIKVGDVDGSVMPGVETAPGNQPFQLWVSDRKLEAGARVQVPVTARQLDAVRAFQFTLRFDPSALQLEDIDYGLMEADDFGWGFLDKGWVTASSYKLPENAETEEPLFTLTFHTRRAGSLKQWLSLGSDFTRAEAYSAGGQVYRPELAFTDAPEPAASRLQNVPNPFSGQTAIRFHMEEAGPATLLIYGPEGRLLRQFSGWYEAGSQEILLSSEGLPEGMLFYTLQTEGGAVTERMVVRR